LDDGIVPNFSFVSGPHTNGVAGRLKRVLKGLANHGPVFKNKAIEEACPAVAGLRTEGSLPSLPAP
jgi:hypothetical protein